MIIDNPDIQEQYKIIKILENECQEIINIYRKNKKFFYRGVRSNYTFFKKHYAKQRKPMNMDKNLSDLIDDALLEMGKKAKRDNSVFVTSSQSHALSYGNLYIFFPKNGFHFTYSKKINDLFLDFRKIYDDVRFNRDDIVFFKNLPYQIKTSRNDFFKSLKTETIDFLKTKKPKNYFLIMNKIKSCNSLDDFMYIIKTYYFITDLYEFVEKYLNENSLNLNKSEYLKKTFKKIIKELYDEDNIEKAFLLSNEIMFTDDYYYCLTYDYLKYYETLNDWVKENFHL